MRHFLSERKLDFFTTQRFNRYLNLSFFSVYESKHFFQAMRIGITCLVISIVEIHIILPAVLRKFKYVLPQGFIGIKRLKKFGTSMKPEIKHIAGLNDMVLQFRIINIAKTYSGLL